MKQGEDNVEEHKRSTFQRSLSNEEKNVAIDKDVTLHGETKQKNGVSQFPN